jgi:hypothetical protein
MLGVPQWRLASALGGREPQRPNAIRAAKAEIGEATMTDKRSYEERSAEFAISFINQPIANFVVEPEVVEPETALQRAHRRWHMTDEKQK